MVVSCWGHVNLLVPNLLLAMVTIWITILGSFVLVKRLNNTRPQINFTQKGANKKIIKGSFHMKHRVVYNSWQPAKFAGFSGRFCWLLSFQENTEEVWFAWRNAEATTLREWCNGLQTIFSIIIQIVIMVSDKKKNCVMTHNLYPHPQVVPTTHDHKSNSFDDI